MRQGFFGATVDAALYVLHRGLINTSVGKITVGMSNIKFFIPDTCSFLFVVSLKSCIEGGDHRECEHGL
ncbi:hypothetical protein Y032_0765g2162 [Ancylostoma ceylanicum]|uniref:Uncharacterized protein n=1 Tax=Ancylostoma ceylanicum TaxID=53326 RepID=A0A016WET7_9BILA|nr:hypothetical protein Y032_0765g2162 [Ancylostoma ceylanicum]